MTASIAELGARRERLVRQSSALRAELARAAAPLRTPAAWIDQGVAVVIYLRTHPGLVAGLVAVLAILRPRRTLRWARRGWFAWRMYRRVRNAL